MKATWKNVILADSNDTFVVEGNHYFPSSAVNMEYMVPSETHTICPWKGVASYYTLNVNGELNEDAAWYYPETKKEAGNIQGRIAFWRGVKITG